MFTVGTGSLLQWGRSHSTAETTVTPPAFHRAICRFNGAAVTRLRKPPSGRRCVILLSLLQWGRSHSTAETFHAAKQATQDAELQWGRSHSTAETCAFEYDAGEAGPASMGPQSLDCGNPGISRITQRDAHPCFNGAAVTRLRKLVGENRAARVPMQLQWGRSHSTAETARFQRCVQSIKSSFNGAAVTRLRKLQAATERHRRTPASMGPQSLDCGNCSCVTLSI